MKTKLLLGLVGALSILGTAPSAIAREGSRGIDGGAPTAHRAKEHRKHAHHQRGVHRHEWRLEHGRC